MPSSPAASPTFRESGLGSLMLVGALAVGTVSAVLVVLSATGLWFTDSRLTVADGDLAEAAIGQPQSGVEPGNEEGEVTTTSVALVPTSAANPEVRLWSESSVTTTTELSRSSLRGVFASAGLNELLASFIVHDGLIITSAGAVSGVDNPWLSVAGDQIAASVEMVDPYTDVAVLSTAEPLPEELVWSDVVAAVPDPGDRVDLRPTPLTAEDLDPTSSNGYVTGFDQRVMTALNRHCYGAFITSHHSSVAPPGSAVVDEHGAVVGMTISTTEPTVAAIPITTVLDVAASMSETGSPAAGWLGIEAAVDEKGRTLVIEVAAAGPAAEVLSAGDVIMSIDGMAVDNADHLVHLVRDIEIGNGAEATIERDGEREVVVLQPAAGDQNLAVSG